MTTKTSHLPNHFSGICKLTLVKWDNNEKLYWRKTWEGGNPKRENKPKCLESNQEHEDYYKKFEEMTPFGVTQETFLPKNACHGNIMIATVFQASSREYS